MLQGRGSQLELGFTRFEENNKKSLNIPKFSDHSIIRQTSLLVSFSLLARRPKSRPNLA